MHPLRSRNGYRRWAIPAVLVAVLFGLTPWAFGQPQSASVDSAKSLQEQLRARYPDSDARVTAEAGPEGKDVFRVEAFAANAGEARAMRELALATLGLREEPGRLVAQIRVQPRVEVLPEYTLSPGETMTIQARSGRNIESIILPRANIVDVIIDPGNPRRVRISGKEIGIVRLTLIDDRGDTTITTIRVEPDLSYLKDILARQFPKAAVTITSGGKGVIVVSGTVDSSEDIDPILQFITLYGEGYTVINAMRLGGVQQIQLEVCIAQVSRSEFRKLGFNFFHSDDDNSLASSTINNLVPQPFMLHGAAEVRTSLSDTSFLAPLGNIGAIPNPDTNAAFAIFDDNSAFFGFLEATRGEGVSKLLANPTLVCINGRQASFLVGGEVGIPAISALGVPTIIFKEFGTRLEFLPTILSEGKIRLEVTPEVSTIVDVDPFRFQTTRVSTKVEMENGQTLAIGGLLQTEVVATALKTPVLGDLPFIGAAFRSLRYDEREQELLIIVTPRLVDPLDCSQRTTKLPGQESRSPTDFELFLEGILEAPRGPRDICPDGRHYKASHWPCEDACCGPNGRGPGPDGYQGAYTPGAPVGAYNAPHPGAYTPGSPSGTYSQGRRVDTRPVVVPPYTVAPAGMNTVVEQPAPRYVAPPSRRAVFD